MMLCKHKVFIISLQLLVLFILCSCGPINFIRFITLVEDLAQKDAPVIKSLMIIVLVYTAVYYVLVITRPCNHCIIGAQVFFNHGAAAGG